MLRNDFRASHFTWKQPRTCVAPPACLDLWCTNVRWPLKSYESSLAKICVAAMPLCTWTIQPAKNIQPKTPPKQNLLYTLVGFLFRINFFVPHQGATLRHWYDVMSPSWHHTLDHHRLRSGVRNLPWWVSSLKGQKCRDPPPKKTKKKQLLDLLGIRRKNNKILQL